MLFHRGHEGSSVLSILSIYCEEFLENNFRAESTLNDPISDVTLGRLLRELVNRVFLVRRHMAFWTRDSPTVQAEVFGIFDVVLADQIRHGVPVNGARDVIAAAWPLVVLLRTVHAHRSAALEAEADDIGASSFCCTAATAIQRIIYWVMVNVNWIRKPSHYQYYYDVPVALLY